MKPVLCNYCGRIADYMSSQEFYGTDYGTNVYSCVPCNAYVGTHRGSSRPLGTLAKAHLRALRMEAHSLFDPLWQGKGAGARSRCYVWLAKFMGVPQVKAHIGMFDEEQCQKLIAYLSNDF